MQNIFITGGLGFIGSNFANKYPKDSKENLIILDKFSYASNLKNLDSNFKIIKIDISNYEFLSYLYSLYKPKITYHFAAESHVDKSICNDDVFVKSNIIGTHNILKCIVKNGGRLVHISTDEVYGSLKLKEKPFTEKSNYNPRNPYAASKASSDHLVISYVNTHKIDAVVTNCSNNYGPRQNIEKFIPKVINCLKQDKAIPIYGKGKNIRDWIFVDDHCSALFLVGKNGVSGEKYNIGSSCEISNISMVKLIANIMKKKKYYFKFLEDRKGHDFRYSINSNKIKNNLKWKPKIKLREGLIKTIEWYNA